MKPMTIALIAAAAAGGFILIKNVKKASAASTTPSTLTTGYQLPITSQSYTMYEVPQASLPKQSDVNVGLTSSGINYTTSKLNVTLGTDFLQNIPILGNLLKSL